MKAATRGPSDAPDREREKLLPAQRIDTYGPLVVALYFMATTRWGSYLLPGPPYVGDMAILVLLVNRLLLVAAGRSSPGGRDVVVAIAGGALLTWAGLRFAFGEATLRLDPDAARDAAPYLYCVLAFLVVPLSSGQERVARRMIDFALIFHLAWVTMRVIFGRPVFAPSLPWSPSSGLYVFGLRPDVDTTICGVLAALCLHRALSGRRPLLNLAVAGWALVVTFAGLDARAGVLALGVQLLVVAALAPVRKREEDAAASMSSALRGTRQLKRLRARRLALAALIVIVPIAVAFVPSAPVVKAFPLGFKPHDAHPFAASNADDTARARLRSWSKLISWVDSNPGRAAAGVGFGPHFYLESGALGLLSTHQREEVRSPHNYWLNTWARLGLVGLALVFSVWLAALRAGWLVARHSPRLRDSDLVAILVVVAMPITATFSVVMESPFGAIPFFWAVGHLSVRVAAIGAGVSFREVMRGPRARPVP